MSQMTRADFLNHWGAVRTTLAETGALVDGAKLLDRVLADAEALFATEEGETLSLGQAAAESGYSRDHIARLIRGGAIPNAGRPRSPRVRRADLPLKPSRLPNATPRPQLLGADPEQIARSVVTSHTRGAR